MKYCPYCGASLLGSAVSYCAECGKALPQKKAGQQRRVSDKAPSRHTHRPSNNRLVNRPRPKSGASVNKRLDDHYDGYYDDVPPVDAGWEKDRVDTGLVKRVILLVLGALSMISLAILMMTLL